MQNISIKFISEKLRDEVKKLKYGTFEEQQVHSFLQRAFVDIEHDLSSCVKIPKKLWPKEYKKYQISNLWKYDLPGGWRVLFFLETNQLTVVAIILEWLSHKEYERRFKY